MFTIADTVAQQKQFQVTGLPALIIFLVILAIFVAGIFAVVRFIRRRVKK